MIYRHLSQAIAVYLVRKKETNVKRKGYGGGRRWRRGSKFTRVAGYPRPGILQL